MEQLVDSDRNPPCSASRFLLACSHSQKRYGKARHPGPDQWLHSHLPLRPGDAARCYSYHGVVSSDVVLHLHPLGGFWMPPLTRCHFVAYTVVCALSGCLEFLPQQRSAGRFLLLLVKYCIGGNVTSLFFNSFRALETLYRVSMTSAPPQISDRTCAASWPDKPLSSMEMDSFLELTSSALASATNPSPKTFLV